MTDNSIPGLASAPLILASASQSRLALLRSAGLRVEAFPARVDEAGVKQTMRASGASGVDTAMALAELKAQKIATQHPEALVIGADQLSKLP